MPLAPGARLGPYELVEPLGAGGMGEVYKARDTRLERFVALKVLSAEFEHDPAGRKRFEREARAIAALEHPHICPASPHIIMRWRAPTWCRTVAAPRQIHQGDTHWAHTFATVGFTVKQAGWQIHGQEAPMPKPIKTLSKPSALARSRTFSDADLRGDYAFAGHTDAAGGVTVPGGVIGRLTADGRGNVTDGFQTLSGGGDAHHESINCTYAVTPNGAGSMTCTYVKLDGPDAGSTATGTSDFVLADGGREIFTVITEPGEVQGVVTIWKRQ